MSSAHFTIIFLVLMLSVSIQAVEKSSNSTRTFKSILFGDVLHVCKRECRVTRDTAFDGFVGPPEVIRQFHTELKAYKGAAPELILVKDKEEAVINHKRYASTVNLPIGHVPCKRRSLFVEDPEAKRDEFRAGKNVWNTIASLLSEDDEDTSFD